MKIVYDAFANKSVFLGNYTLKAEMRNYLINRYFAGGKSSRPYDIIIEGKRYRETMEKVDSSNSVQLRLKKEITKEIKDKLKESYEFFKPYIEQDIPTQGMQTQERISIYETELSTENLPVFEIQCVQSNQSVIVSQEWEDAQSFVESFPEGGKRYVTHIIYERSKPLVEQAKKNFIKQNGKLFCEVCGFDFAAQYGERGAGFIEAHHDKNPVSQMGEDAESKVEDLKMVCANCHRILHRSIPWMRVDELREAMEQIHSENQ